MNYILLLIYIFEIIVAFYVLIKQRQQKVSWSFFLFIVLSVSWGITLLIVRQTASILAGQCAFASGALLVLAFLLVAITFPNNKSISKFSLWLVALPILNVVIAFIPNTLFRGITIIDGSIVTAHGLLYYEYIIYVLAYFIIAICVLLKKYTLASNSERLRLRFFLLGLALFSTLAILSNGVLPAIGIMRFNQWGSSFSIIFIGFTAYAITRYRLFDITFLLKRWVILLFAFVVAASVMYGASYILWLNFHDNVAGLAAGLAIVLILLQIVLYHIYKKVSQIENIDLAVPYLNQELIASQTNVKEYLEKIQQLLAEQFKVTQSTICVFVPEENRFFAFTGKNITISFTNSLIKYVQEVNAIFVLSEVEERNDAIYADAIQFMHKHGLYLAIPFMLNQVIYGFLFVHADAPAGERLYSRNTLEKLRQFTQKSAILLQQIILFNRLMMK